MLHMKNIRKVYRTEHIETHALNAFNLEVGEGEFHEEEQCHCV